MKFTNALIIIMTLAISASLDAQVKSGERSMSQGVQNALVIEIPGTTEKTVESVWKDFVKDLKGKAKRDRKSNGWFTDNADIPSIGGSSTVDLYAGIQEKGDDVEFTLWIDMGTGYLSKTAFPDRYDEGEKLLMRFALEVAREEVRMDLDEEEKQLKDLEKELKNLERDNEKYNKDIEDAKKLISERESDILENERLQAETSKKLEVQKEVVEDVRKKLDNLNN